MKILFPAFRIVAVSVAGSALMVSCDKQEAVAPAPGASGASAPMAEMPAPVAASTPVETVAEAPVAEMTSPAAAPAGDAVLETFKAEIKAIKAFMEEQQGNADPASGLASLKELVTRASAVRTEGLPEDLSSAYAGMTAVMQRVQDTLSDLPVPVEQLEQYMKEEQTKGAEATQEVMAKMAAFQTSMSALQKDGEAASAKLKEVGAKYGIESLDLGN